jgi:hypothetical protein
VPVLSRAGEGARLAATSSCETMAPVDAPWMKTKPGRVSNFCESAQRPEAISGCK